MTSAHLEDLPGVPPALLMIWLDLYDGHGWDGTRKRLRTALNDFRDQSFAFDVENIGRQEVRDVEKFHVHMHGALDLLSESGCSTLDCRISAAERIANSFGLLADKIWLTDFVSSDVALMGRATNARLDRFIEHAVALSPLLPLIKAGIVGFRSPWVTRCADCSDRFEEQIESITRELLKTFRREFRVKRESEGVYTVSTGNIFSPPMVNTIVSKQANGVPRSRDIAYEVVSSEVRRALFVAREASLTGGSVLSNSRVALSGLLQCDGMLPPSKHDLLTYEENRTFDLPWVSELTAEQVLQLRDDASEAIPTLRVLLAKTARFGDPKQPSVDSASTIDGLRIQAEEVRAELLLRRKNSAKCWKTTAGVLGVGFSLYGAYTQQPAMALAALLPVIQLLIHHRTSHDTDVEKLYSRPGYVLVKAKDILAHSHR